MANLYLNCQKFATSLEKCEARLGGIRYEFRFENGYGASVIKFYGSYGYEKDLWELAVLDHDGDLCCDTEITDDVIGYLADEEVCEYLEKISKLPPRGD